MTLVHDKSYNVCPAVDTITCQYIQIQRIFIHLKEIAQPQFHSPVAGALSEIGIGTASEKRHAAAQFQICDTGIDQLGNQGITAVMQIDDTANASTPVQRLEGFLLRHSIINNPAFFPSAIAI